jgi:hypothetical protein
LPVNGAVLVDLPQKPSNAVSGIVGIEDSICGYVAKVVVADQGVLDRLWEDPSAVV